jgi:MYXO-CTERM domain-containing protein
MLYSPRLAAYALSAALTFGSAGAVYAQSTGTGPNNATGTTASTADTRNTDHQSGDWGWLGLIGLIGLAGLAGRSRNTTRDINRDTNRGGAYRTPAE